LESDKRVAIVSNVERRECNGDVGGEELLEEHDLFDNTLDRVRIMIVCLIRLLGQCSNKLINKDEKKKKMFVCFSRSDYVSTNPVNRRRELFFILPSRLH